MLTCSHCSGFVPDDCALCPNCGTFVSGPSLASSSGEPQAGSTSAVATPVGRLLKWALRSSWIAGSSVMLAACYGSPGDYEDGIDGEGGQGSGGRTPAAGGLSSTGGASTGGAASGGTIAGGEGGLGGAGEGGLGGGGEGGSL